VTDGGAASGGGRAMPLLLAWGNTLRGDDGVGWHVADAVRALAGTAPVTVITAHQLAPELAEPVAAASVVVFVDAACDVAPGTLAVRPVAPAMAPAPGMTQHEYHPAEVLRLARAVFGSAPAAWLITIGVADLDGGAGLSPAVSAAVPHAAARILDLLVPDLRRLPEPPPA
jgi:hydrogenase maturation protease